ncbi:MAG: ROK family protein [Burkholderiales bacterium]|nr:ROK family protein [Burkholderiales bacterium]
MLIGGVDIGGTKMAAVVANAEGPLARVVQSTAKSGTPLAVPEQVLALLDEVCREANIQRADLKRVGICSAGPFISENSYLALATPNLCGGLPGAQDLPNDWTSIPLEKVLRSVFADVVIRNDCIGALIAERNFGAVRNVNDCIYVTWSTGIGFGLCVDGHVLQGKHGNAGHAGHLLLSEVSQALCGCGNRGDTEGLISGRNIERLHGRSAADIFEAARQGDQASLAIVNEAAQWFGKALYNLAVTLDTRVFVIGGSVWLHHGDWIKSTVQREIASRLPSLTDGVELRTAQLRNLVADIGGLCLVMPEDWIAEWQQTTPWKRLP